MKNVRGSSSIEKQEKSKRKKMGQSAIQSIGYNGLLIAESSPKPDKIVCGHRYSLSKHISGYILDSNLFGKYVIPRQNSEENLVLTHKKYQTTLKLWLEKNVNNWCPDYLRWDVCRPKEEARQIIQGILHAVHKLHFDGNFHGFLDHTENYLICCDKSVIGGDCKETKLIILANENEKMKEKFELTTKKDIVDMSNVIFKQILGVPPSNYPQDLQNLETQLASSNDLESTIVNHPSLWHWKSRFDYIEHVWKQYVQADGGTQKSMMSKFRKIYVEDWKSNAQSDSLLNWMVHRQYYGDSIYYLLRYLRNVHIHYKENVQKMKMPWNMKSIYSQKQYIELKTTKVSELLLVHLYRYMCEMKIEI